MIIPGYGRQFSDDMDIDALTFDAWDRASDPGFWAVHLLRQGFDEDLVLPGFGVSESAAQRLHAKLSDSRRWPVFPVAVGSGSSITVVYRNFGEDDGVDYLFHGKDLECVPLASLEGHFSGPGASWEELVCIARDSSSGRIDGRKLLLLWPMAGDTAAVEAAKPAIEMALREVGADGDVDELAEMLVTDHPMWDLASWGVNADGNLECDGEYSPRNPAGEFFNGSSINLLNR